MCVLLSLSLFETGDVSQRRRQAVKIFRHNPCVFWSMYLLWLHCLFLFSLKFNYLQRVYLNEKINDNSWNIDHVLQTKWKWRIRAFSCDVIAAMLEGKHSTFSLPWEIRSIFMQNCFIVSALHRGCRENPLLASHTRAGRHEYQTYFRYSRACFCLV